MNELIEGFSKVAIASVADAVDKVCGQRGYLNSHIKKIAKSIPLLFPNTHLGSSA